MSNKSNIDSELVEILMGKFNEEALNKIEKFKTKHKDESNFMDYDEQIELYLIEQELKQLNYREALERIAKLGNTENSKRYTFILNLKFKALIGLGNYKRLQRDISEILKKRIDFSSFFYLDLLKIVLLIESKYRIESLLSQLFQLSAEFIGYPINLHLSIEEMSLDLLSMNKSSNMEYGKLVFNLERNTNESKISQIEKYLLSESLGYYKNMATAMKKQISNSKR